MEIWLFAGVAFLAVVAAAGMLLSKNAVLSALCLIGNFICVAFLYVMLDAPFLAMVQIAVYAGAIMVLFLFVIMLLGAENVGGSAREFKWITPVTLALALSFVFATFFAFNAGDIDTQNAEGDRPYVRVAHAAAGFPEAVDIYADGALLASDVDLGEASEFLQVEPGDYDISVAFAGDDPALAIPVGSVTLLNDTAQTVVAYGEERLPLLGVVQEDLSGTPSRSTRVTVFNAYPAVEAVTLVEQLPEFSSVEPEVYAANIPYGQASTAFISREREPEWAFVRADRPEERLFSLREYELTPGLAQLIILGAEPLGVGEGFRPISIEAQSETLATFGSPASVGALLFIDYVLPFEIVAVLLLAAMVGAIVLTQRGTVKPKPGRPLRRKVSRPLTSVIASQTGQDVTNVPELPQLREPEQPEPAGD
ncbi:MAG: NADH-quinone oxidoreductase subunit J [bacterium]|nr:NADH-quinone oxidoreductase subunit J [bacterium]